MYNLPKGFITKILAKDKASGLFMEFQKIAPNSVFPEHKHTSKEWIYIIKGKLCDEFGEYPAGTFKTNRQFSIHAPFSKIGCELIVVRKGNYRATKK